MALGMTGVRMLLTLIDNYKTELQQQISIMIDAPVKIGALKARMHGFTPSLVVKDIKVAGGTDGKETPVKLDEIRLHVDLRELLFKQALWTSSWITLVGAELSVTQRENGSFAIVGLKANAEDENPLWLLQGSKFELLHSRITWQSLKHKGEPLTFDRVDLVVKNDSDQHQLHMLLKLPSDYGDSLRLSMALDGNFFEPANINGRMYVEGHGIHLAKMAKAELPLGISLESGTGDFKIWTDWQRSQLIGVSGEAKLQQLTVNTKRDEVFSAKQLSGRFNWQRWDQNWQLDVGDFVLEAGNRYWSPGHFSIRGDQEPEGRLRTIALAGVNLELQEATQLLMLPDLLTLDQEELLNGLKLSGRLETVVFSADLDAKRFSIDGRFQGLTFSKFKGIPGLSGLTGRIHGNDRRGSLQLDTGPAAMEAAGLFRQSLTVDRLAGRIDWRQTDENWILRSRRIELEAPGIKTASRMKLVLPNNGRSPFLDLQTAFSIDDAGQTLRYLPVTIMNPDTVAWLDRAFVAGRVRDGGLLIHGELADFPFTAGQGVFEVLFKAEQMELRYHPEWPVLSGLDAEVRFWSESLAVKVLKARTGLCTINEAMVRIPSFTRSKYVKVRGRAEGSIPEVLRFLQQTPIKDSIDRVSEALTPSGATTVELELDAPMVEQAPVIVDGSATLKDASVTLSTFGLPVTRIDGLLKFNELGVFADELNAVALDYPIRIEIDHQPGQAIVNVAGHATVRDLGKLLNRSEQTWADGDADYQLELMLPYDQFRSSELIIRSDLKGVALDLPESLAKNYEQKRPLSLRFDLSNPKILPVVLNYSNLLKASFTVDIGRQAIQSGHFLYGSGHAHDPGKGIKLEANRDRIQLGDWLAVSKGLNESPGIPIDHVEIHTGHLISGDQDLGRLDWDLKRNPEGWRGRIQSLAAEGELYLPSNLNGKDKIKLDLQFIDFSVLNRLSLKGERQEGTVSAFDIQSRKTFWRSVDLGKLELETEQIPAGLSFSRVALTGPERKLSLTGSWTVNNGLASTQLQGSFNSERFGRLLAELGLYDDMKETGAYTNFVLDWRGAPYQFALAELNGHIDVKLKNGRLSSIEPGVGRVIGILAFAQWGKRLQLDFRDVYKEGLSFNSIRGRINLNKGIARTDNLVVNAVPAKISLVGDANLIERTLDQWVTVVPKSSDAVPIAGTIVGRIAGLVASAVTDDYKEGYFFGSEYQVKGSWLEPDIIPLHENDGLFKKTWQGITDFPWLDQK